MAIKKINVGGVEHELQTTIANVDGLENALNTILNTAKTHADSAAATAQSQIDNIVSGTTQVGKATSAVTARSLNDMSIGSSSNAYQKYYRKFATAKVTSAWQSFGGTFFLYDAEGQTVSGIFHIKARTGSTYNDGTPVIYWLSLSDKNYVNNIVATKDADGEYSYYLKSQTSYNSYHIIALRYDATVTFTNSGGWVERLENIVATSYLSGNVANAALAETATKATQDASGNTITSTYATKTELGDMDTALDGIIEIQNALIEGDEVYGETNSSHTHTIANIANLQTTLDSKQATVTGAATTITDSNLTASRALVSNSSGKVAVSDITSTELGYLDGVTSNVQTQLNGKANVTHTHNNILSRGNTTAETETTRPSVNGLSMSEAYNNGYPEKYGNILNLRGTGDGQLFIGWAATSGSHAPVYVRSKRDRSDANWSDWAQVYTTANKPTPTDIGAASSSEIVGQKRVGGLDYDGNEFFGEVFNDYVNNVASGNMSHAEGCLTTASGDYSHTEGYYTTASAYCSHAEGYGTTASGNHSHAAGCFTTALNNQYVIGHDNASGTAGSSSGITGDAFIIGKGTQTSKSNAFRVTYAGQAYAVKTSIISGADYAEFFEWQDSNPYNEDRRGYFVTMDGEKIKIAEPNDYILGIVSGMPAIIGNGDEDWRGRYILDDFGDYITEEFEYEEEVVENIIDEETGEVIPKTSTVTKIGTRWKENPDYDPSIPYIQREDRPEWDAIGMIGVLSVRDDGTCKINGFCKVAEGGIATASENGYRVISRVNENIVKVVFR